MIVPTCKLLEDGDATGTRTELRMLTPRYASPEQMSGRSVTTASDLYSLGVVLYELLTGTHPQGSSPDSTASGARATEPEPPSVAVLRTDRIFGVQPPDFESTIELPRGRRANRIARALRGDLDTIVLRALKPDPAERFATASALDEDLRRYRLGLPIESRLDSPWYRAHKFVARNRVAVASATLVAATVTVSAGVSFEQARRARMERDLAEEVSALLEELFWSPNPYGTDTDRPDTLRIRDLMEGAATRVREDLDAQPAVQARLLGVLGNVASEPRPLRPGDRAAPCGARRGGAGARGAARRRGFDLERSRPFAHRGRGVRGGRFGVWALARAR